MKKEVGLWIDHREAVLVSLLDESEEIKRITSNMEKHVRYSGASESSGSHNDSAEDKRDRRFDDHLNTYYDEVIVALRDADSILILGPGEAKIELQKRLENHEHSDRTIVAQPADKMTDNQIVAEVRRHFRESQHG
jgi:stalled ribosome rescue protein Dom34